MVTHTSLKQAAAAVDASYNMAKLKQGMAKYVSEFLQENISLAKTEGVGNNELKHLNNRYPRKIDLADMTGVVFASEKLFKAFRDDLPPEIREIMRALVWRESLSNEAIEKEFGFKIYDEESIKYGYNSTRKRYTLKTEFEFFVNNGNEYAYTGYGTPLFNLSLGDALRKIIQSYYPRPRNADLHFINKIETTDFIFEGETEILTEFPRLAAYATQGQIKTTKNGKVSIASTGKLQKKVGVKEFYPDEEDKFMKNLRSGLLAGLISAKKNKVGTLDIHEQIRSLFQDTFARRFLSPVGVLSYFKGMSYMDKHDNAVQEQMVLNIFRKLPPQKWVSGENFIEFLRFNSLDYKPVQKHFAQSKLYFEKEQKTGYKDHVYIDKQYITKSNYTSYVTVPYQKGICFLLAAYGLLDIAYDSVHFLGDEKIASPYEGLKYMRLTKLGAYVLGVTDSYELPDSFQQSVTILSEDSLTITADENDTTAPMVLEPYAVRVSPNRYRTDFAFFLKGVKSKRELESKITLFKQAVKVDLPENWVAFFNELGTKIDPLTKFGAVKVFKIPKENTDLLKLIARDPILQKHSLKAENYHIIIPNKSMAAFRNRLREFGYLLS